MEKPLNFKPAVFAVTCFLYFAAAFLFKHLVAYITARSLFPQNEVLEFYYVRNTGAAFSILTDKTLFLCLISIVILGALFFYFKKHIKELNALEINGFCFLIAGIFSNLTERLFDGFVTDYFRLLFVNFPIFNLADVFINIGAILLIIALIESKRYKNV